MVIERMKQVNQEQFDAAVDTFDNPDKFQKEWLVNLYDVLISGAKRSIEFYQEQLVHLSMMRDRYQNDLETGELIWNNIALLNDAIKEEMQNIAGYRETKHGTAKD